MNSMGPMGDEDDDIASLLRGAGLRVEPPAAARERVHASALTLFEALPTQSADQHIPSPQSVESRRRFAPPRAQAIAATFVVAAFGGLLWLAMPARAPAIAARVNYSNGSWLVDGQPAQSTAAVPRDVQVQTRGDAALELTLSDGALLRADHDTRFVLGADRRIDLRQGRIYIDARGAAQSVRVTTAYATVRDIGTQFEVMVDHSALTVVVREGQVQAEGDHLRVTQRAPLTLSAHDGVGESVRIDAAGRVQRGQVATTSAQWLWLSHARARYALHRGNLHHFLQWSAAESGLELRYRNDAVRRAAVDTHVRGNIDGMSPEEAIANVLATTRLRRAEAAKHELLVDFAAGD